MEQISKKELKQLGGKVGVVMKEAPGSGLSKLTTIADDLKGLDAVTYETVNLQELEMRIGLAARIILEHTLRSPGLNPKDKCDIALRAITVLEGTKSEVTWRTELMRRPARKDTAILAQEKEVIAAKLIKAAMRRKEIQISQAEMALSAMEPAQDETN